jgi:hypothetical protein
VKDIKEQAKIFYLNNYDLGFFDTHTSTYKKYMNSLKDIYDENLKDEFFFQEKYPYSKDLRPKASDYDDSFIDILFENGIDRYLSDVIGVNMQLSHIQARLAYPYPDGKSSSQMWHRDSYVYDGNFVGYFPPPVKLIFYPRFDNDAEPVLACVPNSSLTMRYSREQDMSQIVDDRVQTIHNSNDQFIIFNTSMLHSTLPVREKNLRIIYIFNYEHSLDIPAKKMSRNLEE